MPSLSTLRIRSRRKCKVAARQSAADFLQSASSRPNRPRLLVRVNGLDTGLIDDDLDAIVASRPDAIMLPKAEGGASVFWRTRSLLCAKRLREYPMARSSILAIATETAASLFRYGHISRGKPPAVGPDLGRARPIGRARCRGKPRCRRPLPRSLPAGTRLCVAGAASAQVQAYDTVTPDFRNQEALRREAQEARRDGFLGKMAIHPAQVEIINQVFTLSTEDVAKAHAIVAAFEAEPGKGTVAVNGVMHDRPHLARAKQLLARAQRHGNQ